MSIKMIVHTVAIDLTLTVIVAEVMQDLRGPGS